MSVDAALRARISTRVFLDKPLPLEELRTVLDAARWAPSGGNLQPWRMIAVSGPEREAVIEAAQKALAANPAGEADEYPIYPSPLGDLYKARRYKVGEDMYALLGVPREDKAGRFAWLARNFQFFDAPVGLFFVMDRTHGHGQWAHMGMLMQSIALAAQEKGIATCMQECWGMVRKSLHSHFGLAENEVIYCGMALGYADPDAAVNSLRSERAALDEIVEFRGF